MQVLKPGRIQAGHSEEVTCTGNGNGNGGCGALLLISSDDVYETFNSDYTGDTDYYKTFCCVQCGTETDLERYTSRLRTDGKRPSYEERKAIGKKNLERAQ